MVPCTTKDMTKIENAFFIIFRSVELQGALQRVIGIASGKGGKLYNPQ